MGVVRREGVRNTVIYYAGVVLGYFTMAILLPKVLHDDQYGLIRIIVPYAAMLAFFFELGMPNVIVRFFPYLRSKRRHHNGLLFFALMVTAVGCAVTCLVFLVFKSSIVHFYAQKASLLLQYYYLLFPLAISITVFEVFSAYCRAHFKTYFATFLNEVYVRVLVLALAVLYFFHCFGFPVFVVLYVACYLTNPFLMLFYIIWNKMLYIKPSGQIFRSDQRNKMLGYGLFNFFGGATGMLMDKLDIVFIPGLLNLAYTGIYGIAVLLAQAVALPAKALLMILYPLTAEAFKTNDRAKLQYLYTTSCNVQLFVGSFTFILIWVNFDSFFNLIHHQFLLGKYAFLFLAIGKLFDMATGINGSLLMNSRFYRYDLIFTVFLMALTVLNVNLFIPIWGIAGAGIAVASASILYNVFKSLFVWLTLRMQPFDGASLKIVLTVAGIFVVGTYMPFSGSYIFDILYKSLAVGLLYIVSLFYLRLTPEISNFVFAVYDRGRRIAKKPFGKK